MSDAASTRLRRGLASACVLLTAIATTVTFAPANAAPSDEKAGPTSGSTGRTTVGQLLTPAGQLTTLGDLPLNEVLSPDGKYLVISNNGQGTQSLQVVETASGKVVQTIPYKSPESLYMGLAFSPDGKHLFASAAGNHKIRTYHFDCGKLVETTAIQMPVISPKRKKVNLYPAGLAVTKDSKRLVVADQLADAVSVIDLATNKVQTTHIGHRPVWVTLSKDSTKAFVSSQGGSDVAEVDITKSQPLATHKIDVGFHPNKSVLTPDGKTLYVANGDADTISVVDMASHHQTATIPVNRNGSKLVGANPTGLTLSKDGKRLYVTNSGHNEVAVINTVTHKVAGDIPTGWYPTQIVNHDGKLSIISAKGLGAGPNNGPGHPNPTDPNGTSEDQYSGSMIKGLLSTIAEPDAATLAKQTATVEKNNTANDAARSSVVPNQIGTKSSKIKHVIYVVRENRTFDQELGSNGRGNGDPTLNLFGEESAPNTRALARQFVTFDNYYADAEVSANGWNWVSQANSNPWSEEMWPSNYSGRGAPYPSEHNDPEARAKEHDAYFWEHLSKNNISFRNYGFYTQRDKNGKAHAADKEVLDPNTDHDYIGWSLACPDSANSFKPMAKNCGPKSRVDEWKSDFDKQVGNGTVPTVQFIRLGNDHTQATKVGAPTPQAYVADNDQAVGQLVEAVSKSPIWKDTAIFLTEDDAQNGPDHVDAHRTIGEVISPYTRTGGVDSTFYSTVSMLRTMEGILGIGPLTQFDAFSTPMSGAFTDKPNFKPYTAVRPSYDMTKVNGPDAPLAKESGEQSTEKEDTIDEQVFNKAIWKAVKGADSTMPEPKHSVIQSGPPIYDDDDDDEGEEVKPGDVDLDEVGSYSKDSRGFPVWTPDGDDERFDPAKGIDPCAPKPSPKPTPTPTPKPGAPVPTTAAPSASSGGNNGGGHALPRTGA
ncbi:MAG: alkaline phosphatase family protein [Cutibacterium avidum]|nr:alkaline phosphatase family protein [Cutibacterium avidum]